MIFWERLAQFDVSRWSITPQPVWRCLCCPSVSR